MDKAGKEKSARGRSPRTADPVSRYRLSQWQWLGLFTVVASACTVAFLLFLNQTIDGTGASAEAEAAVRAASSEASYLGGQVCAGCHQEQHALWKGSHHDLAMQPASAETVLGDFDDAGFEYNGITSTFSRRDGKYFVRTDGPDGNLADYEIAYTFGVYPLQQYLVAFPGGRYQVLSIAWDSRPREAGGQRWFHLYPTEHVTHTDVLHWTGLSQNWNSQCADCHSTDLHKNYDAGKDSYSTIYAEVDVACESCHGPGSLHVAWAREGQPETDVGKGLTVDFSARRLASWLMDTESGIARRSEPITSRAEVETCAPCHARRSVLADDRLPGRPLLDTHRPVLLEEGLYRADGQMQDEVYNYGSFLQSRMHAAGVTCSDCHEPHSLKLRAEGNAICGSCHLAERFDTPKHHFHKAGLPGAQCASCHMPVETYMVVDPRHDHGFRIPRPDFTKQFGTPNACNQCHQDKPVDWAIAALNQWYGSTWSERQHFAPALAAGRSFATNAETALAALAADPAQPAIARATAVSLLPRYLSPASLPALDQAVTAADPLLRLAAAEALEALPPQMRVEHAATLLADERLAVRIAAAASLVGEAEQFFAPDQRTTFERTLGEYVAAQELNLDRPESHVNLGLLDLRRGRLDDARRDFEAAMKVAPQFVPARVNLAEVLRMQGREAEAEAALRAALDIDPGNADVHYALGLSLVRQKRMPDAIEQIRQAAEASPANPQYAYAYGLALQSAGQEARALEVFRAAHERSPGSRELLFALVSIHHQRGETADALRYARRLKALMPDDPQVDALLKQLESGG